MGKILIRYDCKIGHWLSYENLEISSNTLTFVLFEQTCSLGGPESTRDLGGPQIYKDRKTLRSALDKHFRTILGELPTALHQKIARSQGGCFMCFPVPVPNYFIFEGPIVEKSVEIHSNPDATFNKNISVLNKLFDKNPGAKEKVLDLMTTFLLKQFRAHGKEISRKKHNAMRKQAYKDFEKGIRSLLIQLGFKDTPLVKPTRSSRRKAKGKLQEFREAAANGAAAERTEGKESQTVRQRGATDPKKTIASARRGMYQSGGSPLEINVGENGADAMKATNAPARTVANPLDLAKAEIVAFALKAKNKTRNLKAGISRESAIGYFLRTNLTGRYADKAINLFARQIEIHYESITEQSVSEAFISGLYKILRLPNITINAPGEIPRDTKIEFGGQGKPGEAKGKIRIPGK